MFYLYSIIILYPIQINNCIFLDLGRTASHYYIKYDTVEVFNEDMNMTSDCVMDEKAIFAMISKAQEFEQLKVKTLFWFILG